MTFPKDWTYYKTRAIKRDSGAVQDWQARLSVAESVPAAYRHFKLSITANNGDSEATEVCEFSLYNANGELFSPNNMTANDAPSPYVVNQSYFYQNDPTWAGYKVFDGGTGYWLCNNPTVWLTLDLGEGNAQLLSSYSIKSNFAFELDRAPRIWTVYGSNDGATWIPISYVENQLNWSQYETRTFSVADICMEGHAQTDLADLRFSDAADAPLNYCIDSIIGATPHQIAIVDVNIADIAITDTVIKCWYGNDEAISESSPENTYLLYDGFERGPTENESAVAYRHFKFDVTESNGTSYCEIQEIRFFDENDEMFSPGNMTANDAPTPYVIAASSEYNNDTRGWKAFSPGGVWHTISSDPTPWITLDLGAGNARKLYYYSFIGPGSIVSRAPKAWIIYGSNDGTTWTQICSMSGQTSWTGSEERGFPAYENGYPPGGNWTVASGTAHIDRAIRYAGTRSLKLVGGATAADVSIPFAAASGEYAIQVYARKTTTAGNSYPIIHGNGSKRVVVLINTAETLKYINAAGSETNAMADFPVNSFRVIEVNNLNFSAGTFDLYYNTGIIKSGIEMNTSANADDVIQIYNTAVGVGADFWIDKLVVRSWLAVKPEWQGDGWSEEQIYVSDPTNLLDGKVIIISPGAPSNLLDGKAIIESTLTDLLDGAAQIIFDGMERLDGAARIQSSDINLLDGKVWIEFADTSLLDGKAFVFIQNIEVSGYYLFDDIVDLEGIFQSRLTAHIAAGGMDPQSNLYDYDDLYLIDNLYGNIEGLFSVGIELAMTDDDPLGVDPAWTDWRSFLVGDYTARAYKFRLLMSGTYPNVTPVVQSVEITIDMPDRIIGFEATVLTTGVRIVFDPPFFAIPEIGISVIDGQEGDKYTITSKDESGFNIAFTNGGSPVERVISGVAKAYGAKETA